MGIVDVNLKPSGGAASRGARDASHESDASAWAALASDDPHVFARGWLAVTGRSFPPIRQGALFLPAPDDASGGLEVSAVWAATGLPVDLDRLKQLGTGTLEAASAQRAPALAAEGEAATAAVPIVIDGKISAMALVEAALDGPAAGRRLMRHLQWSSAWVEAFLYRSEQRSGRDGLRQASLVVEAIESVATSEHYVDAARALSGLLANRFSCGRVAIGVRRGLKSKLSALSESAEFEGRTEAARAFEAAMDEAIDQETVLVAPAGEAGIRLVAYAQEGLRTALSVDHVLTVPIFSAKGAFGAIVLARDTVPFSQNDVDLLDAIAVSAGGALAARHDADRSFLGFVAHRIRRTAATVLGPSFLLFKTIVLAIILGTAALALIRETVRVTAPGTVNGEARRAVSAPFDGYLQTQYARAGDVVRAGTVIAELQDNDLVLNRLRKLAARRQTEAERDQALAKRDLAQAAIARAALEQKDAEIALDDEMLERARIRAPFDAVVVSGDLAQSIGKPVSRGDVLYELAPLDRYRVTLNVPETAIGSIRVGQKGQLLLTALPERPFAVEVIAVTPVARVADGVNSFEVLAHLADPDERVRPAMEGTAKIEAGEASLLWIWTHSFFDWLRIRAWSWLP